MKKTLTIICLLFFCAITHSQTDTLQVKLDSIIKEANLLYSYEKATWSATDLAYEDERINTNIGAYIVHHSNDSIFVTFADKEYKNQTAQYSYNLNNLRVPAKQDFEPKPLSEKSSKLFKVRNEILRQLNADPAKYSLNFKKDFNPNPVLVSANGSYRLYLIIGTAVPDVIPFGNDYLFNADENGKITDWKIFHKTLIASQVKGPEGKQVISVVHSHLKMTPYISATDICTFRLYGADLFGLEEFEVLSTALNKYFTYNASQNKITVTDL
jgi:hypothetical protein